MNDAHLIDRRTLLVAAGTTGAGALTRTADEAAATSRPPVVVTRSVGALEVSCLLDAAGPFELSTREEAFPDATAADWAAARSIDPGAFGDDGGWHLNFQCFVITGPGSRITLVDTGVGPTGSPAADWAPVPGRLPQALAEIGIEVGDVGLVVQTHLHADHVGWAVYPSGEPVFPRARYVVQHTEVAELEAAGSALVPYVVDPLRARGQLHEVHGRTHLAGGHGRAGQRITAVPTPGHTPGHQSVVVSDGTSEIVVTGDVLVHAVQLGNPDVSYLFEDDHARARGTRRMLLRRAQRQHALLATAHLNRPFVHAAEGRL